MKITFATPKPRNPLVASARMRHAGSHRPTGGAVRQRQQRTLRQELDQLDRRKHSP